MHLKGVSESMKTDNRADMNSTGTAVSRERASREATKGAFLNMLGRIADKILSVDMISNNQISGC